MLCSRVQNQLSAYCDRELTGAEMLQIRHHLSACPSCRQEHDGLLQIKRLMGALSGAEPPRPFDPSMLTDGPRLQPRWVRSLGRYTDLVRAPLERARRSWGVWSAVRYGAGHLSLACAVVAAALSAAVLAPPQHADAVSANVPEIIQSDESSAAVALPGSPDPFRTTALLAGAEDGCATTVLPGAPMPRVVSLFRRRDTPAAASRELTLVGFTPEGSPQSDAPSYSNDAFTPSYPGDAYSEPLVVPFVAPAASGPTGP